MPSFCKAGDGDKSRRQPAQNRASKECVCVFVMEVCLYFVLSYQVFCIKQEDPTDYIAASGCYRLEAVTKVWGSVCGGGVHM